MRPFPGGSDVYLQPESFAAVYAGDLTPAQVQILAAAQRPIALQALSESFEDEPTWKVFPTSAVVSTADFSIPTEAQRAMAARARAATIEIEASHAAPISKPEPIADQIIKAAG